MAPLSRFGLERGWDTIVEIVCVIVTMAICTTIVNHTIASSGARSQRIMDQTRQEIQAQMSSRETGQKDVGDHLGVIEQRDQLILDRLTFQQTLLDELRKRGK